MLSGSAGGLRRAGLAISSPGPEPFDSRACCPRKYEGCCRIWRVIRLKIIVAIKQVPERDAQVRIDSAGKWIDESYLQFALNESDAYALEEALQLKEKHGGEVIVLSAGPERIGQTIREALAKGADRAINLACDDLGARDALGVARLLAAAVQPESPDVVLTRLQSEHLGLGQTGVIL